jgi:predicted nucleotidyltransferase
MLINLAPVLEILRREMPGLVAVYLFGSAADGTSRPDSDIDIAFFAGRPQSRNAVLDCQEALAKVLARDVDLVDLAVASTVLQIQAIDEGRLVEAVDPDAAAFFEVRVLREYQDLKMRRAGIEADIVQRGRVYGG